MSTKQSLYIPMDMLREMMSESIRLDRSISWTVQQAWRIARAEVCKTPVAAKTATGAQEFTPRPNDPEGRGPSAQVLEFLRGKFETMTR